MDERRGKMSAREPKRRAGRFAASEFSFPAPDGEQPATFDEGAQRVRSSKENPGEALLTSIDKMAESAHDVIQDFAGTDQSIPDSAAGFAWRVIGASSELKWRIMNADIVAPDGLALANDVMNLAIAHHAMMTEFVDGNGIGSWRDLTENRRAAARESAKGRQREARYNHARWQCDADQIWAREPYLRKTHVAAKLEKLYKGRFSAHTIRQAIKKSDIEQCSPSAADVT